jgi:hypothetical protein
MSRCVFTCPRASSRYGHHLGLLGIMRTCTVSLLLMLLLLLLLLQAVTDLTCVCLPPCKPTVQSIAKQVALLLGASHMQQAAAAPPPPQDLMSSAGRRLRTPPGPNAPRHTMASLVGSWHRDVHDVCLHSMHLRSGAYSLAHSWQRCKQQARLVPVSKNAASCPRVL